MSEELKEPTAFYREGGIEHTERKKIDFPTKEVYDAIYKAVLPLIFDRQLQPRHLASVMLMFAFDVVTTAMAVTDYEAKINGKIIPFEEDMQAFIEQLVIMINAMPDATGANARLLIDKKSIFNLTEELNS